MRTSTVVWILIAASGFVAFTLMQSTDVAPMIRLVFAWYALIVALLLFAVVGVTLSAKFTRLDTSEGFLWRIFMLW
jgi:hypothetical protein